MGWFRRAGKVDAAVASGLMARVEELEGVNGELRVLVGELTGRVQGLVAKLEGCEGMGRRLGAMLAVERKIGEVDLVGELRLAMALMDERARRAEGAAAAMEMRARAAERRVVELEAGGRRRADGSRRGFVRRGRVPVEARDSRSVSAQLRFDVVARDGGRCRYCGREVGRDGHIDHVWPVSMGGLTVMENLVLACVECNRSKSDRIGIWPRPVEVGE